MTAVLSNNNNVSACNVAEKGTLTYSDNGYASFPVLSTKISETQIDSENPSYQPTVIVPFGWQRHVKADSVLYITPSNKSLTCLQQVEQYLQTPGTCKCGLQCPLQLQTVFSFDPKVPYRAWNMTDTSPSDPHLCNHKKKLLAMASFQNSKGPHPQATTGGGGVLATDDLLKKKDGRKRRKKASPYDGLLVSQLLAQREKLKTQENIQVNPRQPISETHQTSNLSQDLKRKRLYSPQGRSKKHKYSLLDRGSPCPNVDVRQIPPEQNPPPYRVSESLNYFNVPSSVPSFLDDPNGYLAQQTAMLNQTISQQAISVAETSSEPPPTVIPLPSNVPLPSKRRSVCSTTNTVINQPSIMSTSDHEVKSETDVKPCKTILPCTAPKIPVMPINNLSPNGIISYPNKPVIMKGNEPVFMNPQMPQVVPAVGMAPQFLSPPVQPVVQLMQSPLILQNPHTLTIDCSGNVSAIPQLTTLVPSPQLTPLTISEDSDATLSPNSPSDSPNSKKRSRKRKTPIPPPAPVIGAPILVGGNMMHPSLVQTVTLLPGSQPPKPAPVNSGHFNVIHPVNVVGGIPVIQNNAFILPSTNLPLQVMDSSSFNSPPPHQAITVQLQMNGVVGLKPDQVSDVVVSPSSMSPQFTVSTQTCEDELQHLHRGESYQ